MPDEIPGEPPILESPLAGLLVLLVEDNDDARTLMSTLLTMCGANTLAAASVAEALATLERATPDLLISDINMPDEDGIELLRQIRQSDRETLRAMPAIALTALDSPSDRERIRAAGYEVYLAKPVDLDVLLESIRKIRAES